MYSKNIFELNICLIYQQFKIEFLYHKSELKLMIKTCKSCYSINGIFKIKQNQKFVPYHFKGTLQLVYNPVLMD